MYFALAPLLFTLATGTQCLASRSHEDYSEKLELRPLHDGKLAASFAFTTSLYNAVPRTPDSLNEDDARAYFRLLMCILCGPKVEVRSAALHTLPARAWPDLARVRHHRAPSQPQRRTMAVRPLGTAEPAFRRVWG